MHAVEPEPEPEPTYEENVEFLVGSRDGDSAGGEELEGPTAIAMYDYDATEENELSFREGDIIWGIEPVSDEWWNGKVGYGAEEMGPGLFPGGSLVFFNACL